MQLSCLQENLAKGLSIVNRATGNSTIPILRNVLLTADPESLTLSTTNLEIGITCKLAAQTGLTGAVTVPARFLSDYVNSLPPERVKMTLNEKTQTLGLQCAGYKSNIKGIQASEFPVVPQSGSAPPIPLPLSDFTKMIDQVGIAASKEISRPTLTGILLQLKPNSLTLAATDGFRLAVKTIPVSYDGSEVEAIIPANALTELVKIIKDQEVLLMYLEPEAKRVIFVAGNITLTSQLIEGRFPDYTQVIPKGYVTRAIINTASFLKSAKLAQLFARDSANIVAMDVTPTHDDTPGSITLTATSAELGDNVSNLEAEVTGEPVQIGFNARYLIDALGAIETPEVALEVTAASSPGVLKPVDGDDYVHVIMPMNLSK